MCYDPTRMAPSTLDSEGLRHRSLATLYFVVQGAAVALWWCALYVAPSTRSHFFPMGVMSVELRSLIYPDLAVLGLGSLVTAWFRARAHPVAKALGMLVAGGALYAAIQTIAWSVATAAPLLSPASMAASAIGSFAAATRRV